MEGVAVFMDHSESRFISKKQDYESFQALFQTYYPYVVRQIIQITHNQSIAEDLAQEVFLKLFVQNLEEIQNIGGWVTQASIYVAFNYLRSEKRRLNRDEMQSINTPMAEPSTEDRWIEQEEITAIRDALTELDSRDQILLLMKYSGYNYKELAQAADVEPSSVGTLLARARKRLKQFYEKRRAET